MTVTQTDQGFEPQLLDYLLMARDADHVEIPAELHELVEAKLHELVEIQRASKMLRMTKYSTRGLCLNLDGGRPRLEFCEDSEITDELPEDNLLYVDAELHLDGTKMTASATPLDIHLVLYGTRRIPHSVSTVMGRAETRSVWTRIRVKTISIPNWDLPRKPQDFVSFLLDWEGLSPLLLEMIQELAEITSGA